MQKAQDYAFMISMCKIAVHYVGAAISMSVNKDGGNRVLPPSVLQLMPYNPELKHPILVQVIDQSRIKIVPSTKTSVVYLVLVNKAHGA